MMVDSNSQAAMAPQFRKLYETVDRAKYWDYFSGPFLDYELYISRKAEHDVNPLVSLVRRTRPKKVLEIGAGVGRLVKALDEANTISIESFVGIEPSEESYLELQKLEVKNFDFKADQRKASDMPNDGFDLIFIASLGLNLFKDDAFKKLRNRSRTSLGTEGNLVVGALYERSLNMFEAYDGNVCNSYVVEPYEDRSGTKKLMHVLVKYDRETKELFQSWLTEIPGEGLAFSTLVERIWTVEEVIRLMEADGYKLNNEVDFTISGGGADSAAASLLSWNLC